MQYMGKSADFREEQPFQTEKIEMEAGGRRMEDRYGKIAAVLISVLTVLLAACAQGCDTGEKIKEQSYQTQKEKKSTVCPEVSGEIGEKEQKLLQKEAETVWEDYREIYREKPDSSLKEMVEKMGKRGYIIIDENNQTNLQNPEKLRAFCGNLKDGSAGKVRFYRVLEENGIRQTDLSFDGRKLMVTNVVLSREKEEAFISYMERYEAEAWNVTEKGYLIYKKYRPAGYDGENTVDAVRVEPLPDQLRELCGRYVPQTGYYNGGLFFENWDEGHYDRLDFRSLFEEFYRMQYGNYPDDDAYLGEIPAQEFESVIQSRLSVPAEILRGRKEYQADKNCYLREELLYRRYNITNIPVPEVTAYREHPDGTLTLTVEAVWKERMTDCAFVHEVTVRKQGESCFQYIGNKIIRSEENMLPTYMEEAE